MRKTILFLLTLLLAVVSWAPRVNAADDSNSSWYLGVGMGADIPVQDWDPNYPLGGGGDLLIGYRFDPALALQLSISPWFLTGGGLSTVDARNTLEFRLSNPTPTVTSYVLLGSGYDVQFASPSGYVTSSLALVGGLGVQFDFHPGEHFFLEGRYYLLVYNNVTQQSIPILVGLSEDL